ncbi:MAG: Flp pilus assembly protein CpaB [Pseudomonadota bacterium]
MLLRALLIVVSGLGLAAGGVFGTMQVLGPSQPATVAAPAEIPTVTVVVAETDIGFGVDLVENLVRLQPWPENLVPPGAFTSLEQIVGNAEMGFRRARRPIVQGEPILAGKVSGFGEKVTIAHVIDPAKRALAIRVDDVTGVGGFVTPGDRVDVVLIQQQDGDTLASTILQDVLIRGVDQVSDEDRNKPAVVRTVTVEVFPDEAQRLVLAQQTGRLSLTLRPAGTHDEIPSQTITRNSLTTFSDSANAALPTAAASVTIRRGATEEVVSVVR